MRVSTAVLPPDTDARPVARVLERLTGVTRLRERVWKAECPIGHDSEGGPRLTVHEAKDGRAILTCGGGCKAAAIAHALGLDVADLHVPLTIETVAEAPPVRTCWRLDELFADETIMRPPPAVASRLAWAGRSTLLACEEKGGKSTLTGFVTARVSRGESFLGEPTIRGPVLVIGLEEFVGDTALRLKKFNADPQMVHIETALPDAAYRLPHIESLLTRIDPVLVIIDSLMAIAAGVVSDSNSSTQMQMVVQGLTDLSHRTGTSLVLIHHARKADGRYRDSSAIGGSVDVIAEMFIPEPDADPSLRRFRMRGRVAVQGFDLYYVNGNDYELAHGVGSEAPLDVRVYEFVRAHPGCGVRDVRAGVKARSQAVDASLAQQVTDGRLFRYGEKAQARIFATRRLDMERGT